MASFSEIINSNQPVLVDFSAEWCGPCKMMAPILKQTKDILGDEATILKVDIDKNPQTAQQFQIQSVPTLILFRNGRILWRQSGVIQTQSLVQMVRQLASA